MKTNSYRLQEGKLVAIVRKPAELAKLQKQVSERFSKDGTDRAFLKLKGRLKLRAKPKSLQPA